VAEAGTMTGRILSLAGVTAAGLGVISVVLFGIAIGFDPAAGAETTQRLVAASSEDALFVKWGALADMFGYYLIPGALIVAVRDRIPWPSSTVRDVSTAGGVAYSVMGSIGAALLAVAAAPLIGAAPDARLTLETVARGVEGIWQWLNPVPFTAWSTGMALAFRGRASLWFGVFSALAAGGVLVWCGRVLDVQPVLIAGLVLWLVPFPLAFAMIGSWAPLGARQ
jgi:hypothetical protein